MLIEADSDVSAGGLLSAVSCGGPACWLASKLPSVSHIFSLVGDLDYLLKVVTRVKD